MSIKIISGHSNSTDNEFVIPQNIEVWFLEKENEVCYVELTTDGLKQSMIEIQTTSEKYKSGQTIKNYNIEFNFETNNKETGHVVGVLTYINSINKFINDTDDTSVTLKDICESFSEATYNNNTTILYCFFCRGVYDPFMNLASSILDPTTVNSGGKRKTTRKTKRKTKTK